MSARSFVADGILDAAGGPGDRWAAFAIRVRVAFAARLKKADREESPDTVSLADNASD